MKLVRLPSGLVLNMDQVTFIYTETQEIYFSCSPRGQGMAYLCLDDRNFQYLNFYIRDHEYQFPATIAEAK